MIARTGCLRLLWVPLLAGLIAALTGCANYRLGTGSAPGFETVYLAPVGNDALVPQATALVSREIRSAFLRDGRVRLAADAHDADAVIEVNLVNYGRQMTTARPDDTGLARKFDVTLEARCTVIDRRSGDLLMEARPLAVTRQVFTSASAGTFATDQLPAEYQTLPHLATELADRVLHAVLDTW